MSDNPLHILADRVEGLTRGDLLARAAQRLCKAGIGISPPITSPHIQFNHIDGPVLHRLDGTMNWLSWRQRFAVWRGKADAWSLEADYQRQEIGQS